MFKPHARFLILAVLLGATDALGLAGCGGSDQSPTSAPAEVNSAAAVDAAPSDAPRTHCIDDWNNPANASLWMGQGFFNGADDVELAVGGNGNCMLAACAGGAICLVMTDPCTSSQYDSLGVAYCPFPGGSATPESLAEFHPAPVNLQADGTIS